MSNFSDELLALAAHRDRVPAATPDHPQPPKERKMKVQKAARAAEKSADLTMAKAVQTSAVELTPSHAVALMERLVDRERRRAQKLRKSADSSDPRFPVNDQEARDINREIAVLKMQIFEHRRAARPGFGQVAPGITRLPITGLATLPDDPDVGGI